MKKDVSENSFSQLYDCDTLFTLRFHVTDYMEDGVSFTSEQFFYDIGEGFEATMNWFEENGYEVVSKYL